MQSGPRNHLYLRPRRVRRGVFAFEGKRKDPGKIAANVDLNLAVGWRQHDLIHQRAQDVGRLDPLLFLVVLQGFVELLDPLTVFAAPSTDAEG
ncbi:hypothetical protein [Rhizobium sp. 007]|uniref:hypothetical protein n=1 Tax=Rhizobium sp. 007 TaxID=2785056 RepID=UPI001FEEA69F|nr:hypothetical protein [Rhizobium sp. 007]